MAKLLLEYDVEMQSGEVHRVVADQRDLARWEVQPFADDRRIFLKARYVSWSAMLRQQLTKVPWEKFNEIECVEVRAVKDAEGEGEQSLDPGQSAVAGES